MYLLTFYYDLLPLILTTTAAAAATATATKAYKCYSLKKTYVSMA